jgi:hypothetical protein
MKKLFAFFVALALFQGFSTMCFANADQTMFHHGHPEEHSSDEYPE